MGKSSSWQKPFVKIRRRKLRISNDIEVGLKSFRFEIKSKFNLRNKPKEAGYSNKKKKEKKEKKEKTGRKT